MIDSSSSGVFMIDFDYDRDYASDGQSRFRTYVSKYSQRLRDAAEDGDVAWALEVWSVATSPMMSPGFIRTTPGSRVLSWHWDGDIETPFFTINFATDALPFRGLVHHRSWYRNYRDELSSPSDPDIAVPNVLPIVRIQVALDWASETPAAPEAAASLYPAAVVTCRWLVTHLNEALDVADPLVTPS